MNYSEFLQVVERLQENSNSFGNQVLYDMAKVEDLKTGNKLADAMWIIGRAYAASPQRRSYGTKKDSFPVRPDNDGRGQFFAKIAERICKFPFPQPESFTYEGLEKEMEKLKKSVKFVLDFNLELSKAIEEFDCAPEKVHCTNHVSFSSKFLHFYYPQWVYIIDNYAQVGANCLFGGRGKDRLGYICDPRQPDTYNPLKINCDPQGYAFEEDVYQKFSHEKIAWYVEEIAGDCGIDKQYANRREYNARGYITHCVRSYLLGKCLKDEKLTFEPMTRLVDTVFLNTKGKLTKREIDDYCKRVERYKQHGTAYENEKYVLELKKRQELPNSDRK